MIFMKYVFFALITNCSLALFANSHKEYTTLNFDKTKITTTLVKCENNSIYTKLEYKDIETYTEDPGLPELPIYYMNISLPLEAYNADVNIVKFDYDTIRIDYPIIPAQEPATTYLLSDNPSFTLPNEDVYSCNNPIPNKPISVAYTSSIAGVSNEVVIAIHPLTYYPHINILKCLKSVSVSISYTTDNKGDKQTMKTFQSQSSIGLPFYDYCVITRDSLIPSFEKIIAWKRTKGIDAGAVSLESILSNTLCTGDTVSSIYDDAGKIRHYLQLAKQSGKGHYVLLGGKEGIMPIRYGTWHLDTWLYDNNPIGGKVPADIYFCELDSNWDIDQDDYYGEPDELSDYGPELFVGRLLCENSRDVINNTDKLLKYERNPGNGDFSYLSKAFYSQCDQMQSQTQAEKLVTTCNDVFTTNTILKEYPSYNSINTISPTGSDVIDSLKMTDYGYLNWLGHGHPLAISTKSNGCYTRTNVYGITSVQADTIPWIRREIGNGLDNLENKDYPNIAYSISCTIAPFDSFDSVFEGLPNIAQSFTMGKEYGGPVLIGNTRYGLISYSYQLQKLFNYYMKNFSLGEALCYAKMNYNLGEKHMMALTTNLIGCPEVHMWTNTPRYFESIVKEDANENDTKLSFVAHSDTVEIAIRDIWGSDEVVIYTFHGTYNDLLIPNGKGKLITLKAQNHLPEILSNEEVSAEVHGRRYIYASDVTIGGSSDSTFSIESDADITIEKSKVLRFREGFSVKRGARFVVR